MYKGKVDLKEIPSYNTNIEIVSAAKEKKPETTADAAAPEVNTENGEPETEAPAEDETPAEGVGEAEGTTPAEVEAPAEGEATTAEEKPPTPAPAEEKPPTPTPV